MLNLNSSQINHVFFYGTLMRDFNLSFLSEAARHLEFVGIGHVFGTLYDCVYFPAAVLTGESRIIGEIFFIKYHSCLEIINAYEGFDLKEPGNSLFLRRCTIAHIGDSELDVWIYEYNGDTRNLRIIESGNYKDYVRVRDRMLEVIYR